MSSLQDHHPGRGRQHDRCCTDGASSNHGEGGAQHPFLPGVQLPVENHQADRIALHQVPVQAIERQQEHRQTRVYMQRGESEGRQERLGENSQGVGWRFEASRHVLAVDHATEGQGSRDHRGRCSGRDRGKILF